MLTIPQLFSAAITSTSGTNPQQAKLQLVTNDSASAAVAALAQLTVNQAALTLGDQVTSSYVDQLLQSLTSIHNSLSSSAGSAQTLASSSEQLASSTQQLADSTGQVASGADTLDQGSNTLAAGAATLSSGAAETATGAAQVAQGTSSLATAAQQLDQGAQSAAAGASTLATTTQRVSTGATVLSNQAGDLETGLGRVQTEASRHADTSVAVADRAQAVASDCPAAPDPVYCDRVAALAAETRVASDGARALRLTVGAESDRSRLVAPVPEDSPPPAPVWPAAPRSCRPAPRRSAPAPTRSAPRRPGCPPEPPEWRQVPARSPPVRRRPPRGPHRWPRARPSSRAAASSWPAAAPSWPSGADQLAGGNDQLATGLTNGAQQVPSYTDDQRNALVTVVTTPVDVGSSADNPATVAASLVPVVLGLALWIGTLMLFLTGPSVPAGLGVGAGVARPPGPGRLAAGGAGGSRPGRRRHRAGGDQRRLDLLTAGAGGLLRLGAPAFAATNQALVSVFGGVGRMVSLAFVADPGGRFRWAGADRDRAGRDADAQRRPPAAAVRRRGRPVPAGRRRRCGRAAPDLGRLDRRRAARLGACRGAPGVPSWPTPPGRRPPRHLVAGGGAGLVPRFVAR